MVREEISRLRLKLNLDNGMDGDKQLIKAKTYGNIHTAASSDALYDVGAALADLQDKPLYSLQRLEEITLINE